MVRNLPPTGSVGPGSDRGRGPLPARTGLEVQRPELVETDHDHLAGLSERVELNDAAALGLEVGVVGTLPGPHSLKADAFLAQQLPQPLVGECP